MLRFKQIDTVSRCAAVIFVGLVLASGFAGKASAVSSGCRNLHGLSGSLSNPGSTGFSNGETVEAGDKIIVKLTATSGSPTVTLNANTGFPATTVRGTANAYPSTLSFTFTSNGAWSYGLSVTTAGGISYVTYCASLMASDTSSDNGYADMVRSVTRSQTEVLEKNLESRIDAAFQASGARLSGQAAPSAGFAERIAAARDRTGDFFAEDTGASRRTSLRELALLGSFDTSQMVLSANETDPAPGVENRSALRLDGPFTLWGHGSYVSLENDFNRSGDDRRYDGDSWGYTLGFDYRVKPTLLTGVSVGYVDTDFTTTYNGGSYEETGWTVAPYAIYRPVTGLTLSAVAGYGQGDVDRTRSGGVSGDTESDQWFAALRGAYTRQLTGALPIELTGRLALLIARKQVDAFAESDGTRVEKEIANMRRLKPGVEAAYSIVTAGGATLQPFVRADYVYDFTDAVNGDKRAYNLGGGLRVNSGTTGLSGSVSAERQFGRSDYDEYGIEGLIAYNFGLKRRGGTTASLAPYVKSNFDAETGQSFGTGLRFSDLNGAATVDLGVTHALYAYENDDEETVRSQATVGKLRVELQF